MINTKKILIALVFAILVFLPSVTNAQNEVLDISGNYTPVGGSLNYNPNQNSGSSKSSSSSCSVPKNLQELFSYGTCLLGKGIIPFLIGLGLVIFLIGVVSYVRAGDNEEKRTAGRDLMIFGIIALFVMVSVWGLVKILYTTFIGSDFSINANAPSGLK